MRRSITDRNGLLDLLAYLCAYTEDRSSLDPSEQDAFLDNLLNARDAINLQKEHSKKTIQANWFNEALSQIDQGIEEYKKDNFRKAYEHVADAEDTFRSGINAADRKTNFIVAPDGETHSTN